MKSHCPEELYKTRLGRETHVKGMGKRKHRRAETTHQRRDGSFHCSTLAPLGKTLSRLVQVRRHLPTAITTARLPLAKPPRGKPLNILTATSNVHKAERSISPGPPFGKTVNERNEGQQP